MIVWLSVATDLAGANGLAKQAARNSSVSAIRQFCLILLRPLDMMRFIEASESAADNPRDRSSRSGNLGVIDQKKRRCFDAKDSQIY